VKWTTAQKRRSFEICTAALAGFIAGVVVAAGSLVPYPWNAIAPVVAGIVLIWTVRDIVYSGIP